MLSAQEIRRKALHAATALIPLLYKFFPDIGAIKGQHIVLILFALFGGLFVFADYYRRHNDFVRKIFLAVTGPFIREDEEDKMTAASIIGISFFLVLLIFPERIAVPACLLLSVGDFFSGLIGQLFGRHYWFKHYSIEGSLAFVAAGLLLFALAFPDIPFWKAALTVSICAIFEGLLSHLNDNLVIPLAAALLLLMLEV